jgi:peptidyl-prolyl cis-trans isomerase C
MSYLPPGSEETDAGAPASGPGGSGRRWSLGRLSLGRVPVVLVAVAVLAGVGGVAIAAARRGGACPPPGAALKAGGRAVSVEELERRVEVLRDLYGVQPPKDGKAVATFRGDAAKALAVAVILDQDVAHRRLRSAEKTARDAMDRFIADRYPQGGRRKFVEELGAKGLAENDVLGEFRRLLDTRRLYQVVTAKVKVDEAEVKKAFAERRDKLAVPERRKLRHLVVATEAAARAALSRVNKSETFAAVAKAVSLDAKTKDQGGELGLLSADQLDPAFAKAAFSTAKGRAFGPVQTKFGWHLGVVEGVTPGHPVTLGEVHDSLRGQVLGEQQLKVWRQYLGRQIGQARICYADRFRPGDPSAPPPDVTPAAPSPPKS